ncbi:hypothetical protein D0T21_22905 [Duganella sp. BJB476]|nr:hypothetical protein D0T21_22905 [Duganella sp. BJB476]
MRGYINAMISLLGLVIASATAWEMFFPDPHFVKMAGFIAFGALCIFLRAVPPKFLIPKSKR